MLAPSLELLLIEAKPERRGKSAPAEHCQFQLSFAVKLIVLRQELTPVPYSAESS